MPPPKPHPGPSNEVTEVQLTSAIEQVQWTRRAAVAGARVGLEVFTRFVGNGAPLVTRLFDASGKTFGPYQDRLLNNRLSTVVTVPDGARDTLMAEVRLPDHGLQQDSEALLLFPPVEVRNAQWSQPEARRGDVLTLTTEVTGAPDGTRAEIAILEHDSDGAHDPITRFPAFVKQGRVEAEWAFEYHPDTDDVPTAGELETPYSHPEYFFRVEVLGIEAESPLLQFKDWVEVVLVDQRGQPVPDARYDVEFADGSTSSGTLDAEGRAVVRDVPPGPVVVRFAQKTPPSKAKAIG
ncbi:MAG: hypothetical protein AAGG50_14695 [Bacteroidota bacterium]